ncbi:hypothetical protein [Telmatospirillum sp.]|uniref:hypothetical protein n=1 Tax=Telmatospirillum sp. TaxID=2079197 RepID=UPI002841DB50|nr:hypothetical protein [Telmatospirillum sp.]MDR3434995.1 hypothetical protein [Telmatospirillum sp.]
MRLPIIICAMAMACLFATAMNVSGAASAQQQNSNADAEHQSTLNKALALLNAPDPAVRIATFERVSADDSKAAIYEALTSKDPTLRSAALAGFFTTTNMVKIKIDKYNIEQHRFIDKVGGAFYIYIGSFNLRRFDFTTVTAYNSTQSNGQGGMVNLAQTGMVSGDRISFAADFANAGFSKCIVNLMLDQAMVLNRSGLARGDMSCNNNERYTVQLVFDAPNAGDQTAFNTANRLIEGVALAPFALLGAGLGAIQQSDSPPKVSAADRQAEIARNLDLLNSPDPAVRLATLEVAVANGDRILRDLVLNSAFASSDPILRNAALAGTISTANTIPISIIGSRSDIHSFPDRIGSNSYVFIRHFDQKTFTFDTITEYNSTTYSNIYKRTVDISQRGMVSGNRLSFVADFSQAGHSKCVVDLTLDHVGSMTHGIMSCLNGGNYAIESDVLE